jgi:hypothetical protein
MIDVVAKEDAMRQFRPVFVAAMLVAPAVAAAQQGGAEEPADHPHMTSSGPAMPVPNANADPGVVDPNTQGNNNTANDRSNPAPTVASEYQKQDHDKTRAQKHKAASPKESTPSDQR